MNSRRGTSLKFHEPTNSQFLAHCGSVMQSKFLPWLIERHSLSQKQVDNKKSPETVQRDPSVAEERSFRMIDSGSCTQGDKSKVSFQGGDPGNFTNYTGFDG